MGWIGLNRVKLGWIGLNLDELGWIGLNKLNWVELDWIVLNCPKPSGSALTVCGGVWVGSGVV